jgi:hypothetical protein
LGNSTLLQRYWRQTGYGRSTCCTTALLALQTLGWATMLPYTALLAEQPEKQQDADNS